MLKILYFNIFDWFVYIGNLVLDGMLCATALYSSLQGLRVRGSKRVRG